MVGVKTERVSRDLRPLLAHVRPHWGRLVAALVLGIGFSAASLSIPLVVRNVLDELTISSGTRVMPPGISTLVLVLIGLIIASGALGFAQWLVLGRLAERVVFDARSSLVRRLLGAAVPELARRSTGELVTRVTSDTVLLREAAAMSVVMVVNGAIALAGALALMASLDIVLFAAMVGAVVIIGGAVALLLPFLGREQARSQAAVGALGGLLSGVLLSSPSCSTHSRSPSLRRASPCMWVACRRGSLLPRGSLTCTGSPPSSSTRHACRFRFLR